MNDLIINGIDHSAFDLDWAKRGGWCIVRGEVCKLISKATYISSDTDTLFVRAIAERMATREECAVAGIEYIEPPARWIPVEPGGEALGDVIVTDGKFVCLGYYRNGWACGYCSLVYRGTHYMILPKLPEETK